MFLLQAFSQICFGYLPKLSGCFLATASQCLSQGLETGCLKLAVVKFLGRPNIQGGSQYTPISTINMYKFIKIRHDIIKQCHGNYQEMKKFNY